MVTLIDHAMGVSDNHQYCFISEMCQHHVILFYLADVKTGIWTQLLDQGRVAQNPITGKANPQLKDNQGYQHAR